MSVLFPFLFIEDMEVTDGYTDDNKQWLKLSKKSFKKQGTHKQDDVSEDEVIIIR